MVLSNTSRSSPKSRGTHHGRQDVALRLHRYDVFSGLLKSSILGASALVAVAGWLSTDSTPLPLTILQSSHVPITYSLPWLRFAPKIQVQSIKIIAFRTTRIRQKYPKIFDPNDCFAHPKYFNVGRETLHSLSQTLPQATPKVLGADVEGDVFSEAIRWKRDDQ